MPTKPPLNSDLQNALYLTLHRASSASLSPENADANRKLCRLYAKAIQGQPLSSESMNTTLRISALTLAESIDAGSDAAIDARYLAPLQSILTTFEASRRRTADTAKKWMHEYDHRWSETDVDGALTKSQMDGFDRARILLGSTSKVLEINAETCLVQLRKLIFAIKCIHGESHARMHSLVNALFSNASVERRAAPSSDTLYTSGKQIDLTLKHIKAEDVKQECYDWILDNEKAKAFIRDLDVVCLREKTCEVVYNDFDFVQDLTACMQVAKEYDGIMQNKQRDSLPSLTKRTRLRLR
ncbi:hypothetical protein BJ741DRAFT_626633 [Chytriomyces cf. hyalinus JEL632]|nr:hypothetical protein BJ741DRAFT_626633 [Chytriomyces cf. hyalinus JEL632]